MPRGAEKKLPVSPMMLLVDEAKASMIGSSRGGSGSVRIVARSYDDAGNGTGTELSYWAHPEMGGVPRVGDRLLLFVEFPEDE
jgi:hypothetical protein